MTNQSFLCSTYGNFTRHIDVGMQGRLNAENREFKIKNLGRKSFANVFGGVTDLTGFTKIGSIVFCKGTYKCIECGLVAVWNNEGLWIVGYTGRNKVIQLIDIHN